MPKYLVLPKIGMNMEEAMIDEWLVQPGDRVEKEQMVVRAETDKAIQDIFATDSGIVYKLLAEPGDLVPCQQRIAILLDEGEEYSEDADAQSEAEELPPCVPAASQPVHSDAAAVDDTRQRISPLARKTAAEHQIGLEELQPAEPGKRIIKNDVLRTVQEREQTGISAEQIPDGGTHADFSRMRQVIAKHMVQSAAEKPRVSLVTTVDCTQLIAWRAELKKQQKVTYNELLARACASALRRYPDMNCVSEPGGVRVYRQVNVGIAVDTPNGLLVPVLRDVANKPVLQLADEFAALVEKTKAGALTAEDMSGGTITISNLGMFGIESFDPIVNAPQCLILGVGCMKPTPVVVDGEIVVRTCMRLSLSFDHAVFDGAGAAKLLDQIWQMLEYPAMILA